MTGPNSQILVRRTVVALCRISVKLKFCKEEHHLTAALMLAGTLGESRQPTASKRRFTRKLDCLQNFIGLLTTVHFFSVLTTFATYFGVIQSDWHVSPPPLLHLLVGTGSAAQHRSQTHSTSELQKVSSDVSPPSSSTIMSLLLTTDPTFQEY